MIGIDGIIITDAMEKAGERMASDCYDASIRKAMGGMGGCRYFTPEDFPINGDLIEKYLDEELNSIQAIYLAMERARKEDK